MSYLCKLVQFMTSLVNLLNVSKYTCSFFTDEKMASNKNNGDNESRDYSEKARMSMPTVNSKKKEPSLQRLVNDESVEIPLTTVE